MSKLPQDLPIWYTVETEATTLNTERGWVPRTSNIIDDPENRIVTQAWNGSIHFPLPKKMNEYTCRVEGMQILSPIQVGGGSFPEGGILPAHLGGVPYIPGSSVRGALMHYLRVIWREIPADEQIFWQALLEPGQKSWQPRKIRFESLMLLDPTSQNSSTLLKPFPLNAQQPWQVFNKRLPRLAVQWQVPPTEVNVEGGTRAMALTRPNKFPLQVILKGDPTRLPEIHPPTIQQKQWLLQRLSEMLGKQGIGRGIRSGYGRLAESRPSGEWTIELTGMKPCVQQHIVSKGEIIQKGTYRWSPQVLRANLRGHFTRLALNWLSRTEAERLTDRIFGNLRCPARLTLTSFLYRRYCAVLADGTYTNAPKGIVSETWTISVQASTLKPLISDLLELASRIGGLGPGWRRPPHVMERFNGFRGSQFTVQPNLSELTLECLTERVHEQIRELAQEYNLALLPNIQHVLGSFVSIWRGEVGQWRELVHGICSMSAEERPSWCGDSQNRPSGYSVRQHHDHSLITVFDPNPSIHNTLLDLGFSKIWPKG